jgi:hypothetical protein
MLGARKFSLDAIAPNLRQNQPRTCLNPARRVATALSKPNYFSRPPSMHRIAAIVCLSLLGAGLAAAGPVGSDDVETPLDGMHQPPDPLADGTAAVPADTPLPSGAARAATAGNAESTPSPTVQAAEIIREAQAGATAAEPPPAATRQGTQLGPAAAAARAPEGENSLREMGKATVQWLKESVPWLREEEQDEDPGRPAVMDSTEWSSSLLEGGKSTRGSSPGDVHLDGATAALPSTTAGYDSGALQPWLDPQNNIVREAIDFVRMVVGHPMTWLVVALFAIGGYAISRFDRRPK